VRWNIAILPMAMTLVGCVGVETMPEPRGNGGSAAHPLDPLTAGEIEVAVATLKTAGKLPEGAFFPILVLREPPKAEVLAWKPGNPLRREAFAVVMDRPAGRTYEAIVDLASSRVLSWTHVPGVQPAVIEEEFDSVPQIVRKDPRWQAAMKKRGIEHFDKVYLDTWAAGVLPALVPAGTRLARAISFYRGNNRNPYGRPIEGVVALVDVSRSTVVEVVDTGVRPVPKHSQDFDPTAVGALREAPKPLCHVQPDGPSWVRDGNLVRWQNWSFRFTLHPREGLVLHTVSWDDHGRARPVLYRASLSEMVVPYGDPDGNWVWRNAFDEGEYGLGRLATPLEPGKDAPDNADFVDVPFAGTDGAHYVLENALTLYERDGGLLWKHFDYETGKSDTRRARELVIGYTVVVGNYDYGVSWIFRQDGSLEMEVALTGILLGKGVEATACESCAGLTEADNRLVAASAPAPSSAPTSSRPTISTSSTSASILTWMVPRTASPS
jgi:primary-amine oxidase